MACMVDFARRQAGLANSPTPAPWRNRRSDKALDICSCDSFSHYACGREFTYWMKETGYMSTPCWRVGENLAWGTGEYGSVRSIFTAWMRSPDHRANVLGDFDETGLSLQVGTLEGHTGTRVWAQHFGSHCDSARRSAVEAAAGSRCRRSATRSARTLKRSACPRRPARRSRRSRRLRQRPDARPIADHRPAGPLGQLGGALGLLGSVEGGGADGHHRGLRGAGGGQRLVDPLDQLARAAAAAQRSGRAQSSALVALRLAHPLHVRRRRANPFEDLWSSSNYGPGRRSLGGRQHDRLGSSPRRCQSATSRIAMRGLSIVDGPTMVGWRGSCAQLTTRPSGSLHDSLHVGSAIWAWDSRRVESAMDDPGSPGAGAGTGHAPPSLGTICSSNSSECVARYSI